MKLDNVAVLISGAHCGIGLAFQELQAGADEVLADARTRQVKQGLSAESGVCLQVRG